VIEERGEAIHFQRDQKNFKINFAEVRNIPTFAVPNETGTKTKSRQRDAESDKSERFTRQQC
jgi:hypothetical protein